MISKLGRVVTYKEEFPLIKFRDPSITWFCKVMGQINIFFIHLH